MPIRVRVPCDATPDAVFDAVVRVGGSGARLIVRECSPRCGWLCRLRSWWRGESR